MLPLNVFFTEFNKLSMNIKKIFFDFWSNENPFLMSAETHWRPNIDIYNTADGIIVKVELAGITQDALKIFFKDDKLTIKGVRHDCSVSEPVTCQQIEIPYGHFERTINLEYPENKKIDGNNIKATYKEGILLIYLPFIKAVKSMKKIRIEIKGDE